MAISGRDGRDSEGQRPHFWSRDRRWDWPRGRRPHELGPRSEIGPGWVGDAIVHKLLPSNNLLTIYPNSLVLELLNLVIVPLGVQVESEILLATPIELRGIA